MEIPDSTENSDNEILGDLGFIYKEAGAEAYCGGYIGDDLVLEFKSYEEVLEQQQRLFRCPPWDEISGSNEDFNEYLEDKKAYVVEGSFTVYQDEDPPGPKTPALVWPVSWIYYRF
ncbi:uncharacterized protein FRV6_00144 [Fusarium oxysporum]|uniref:Uncharacterized protein n=1 Tax=Fusarium oxysporum TaxID=5507 RepID=A0A2H3SHK5_FUSOX|nr:uncharacterized protein FRV6_00144 [Fusarium oxysporum]